MNQSPSFVGYVYLITNLVNEKRYIGCTKVTVARRWTQHRSAAHKGSHFLIHKAIRKYGASNFKVEVLAIVEGSYDDLRAAERHLIASHRCVAPEGYNLTRGGEGVDYTVPETRQRHQEALRKRSLDPKWRVAMLAGAQKRIGDPAWQRANTAGSRRRSSDPEYRQANLALLPKAWAAHSAKAAARDAHLPLEEQAKRSAHRERDRLNAKRRYDVKRAVSCSPS